MRFHHVFLCAIGMLALGVVAAKPTFAQTQPTSAAFSVPASGHIYEGDAQDHCPVYFQTTNHWVDFTGPINGTVTWAGAITALKGENEVVSWPLLNPHSPENPDYQKVTDSHTDTLNLEEDVVERKYLYCYGTAIYLSNYNYEARGKVTSEYRLPSQSTFTAGTTGIVVFNIEKYVP